MKASKIVKATYTMRDIQVLISRDIQEQLEIDVKPEDVKFAISPEVDNTAEVGGTYTSAALTSASVEYEEHV